MSCILNASCTPTLEAERVEIRPRPNNLDAVQPTKVPLGELSRTRRPDLLHFPRILNPTLGGTMRRTLAPFNNPDAVLYTKVPLDELCEDTPT
jgi:hypothetical protein